jgi:hypothetical protein
VQPKVADWVRQKVLTRAGSKEHDLEIELGELW